jgi:hypothetical protein
VYVKNTAFTNPDGWYYEVSKGRFSANYGNFIGPATAEVSAKTLIDVIIDAIKL